MPDNQWIVLDVVSGMMQAEILQGFLDAQEIPTVLVQEGAGHSAFALTVGILGEVQILVPEQDVERARSLLAEYYAGTLETDQTLEAPGQEDHQNNSIDPPLPNNTMSG